MIADLIAALLPHLREYLIYIVPVLVAAFSTQLAEFAQHVNGWLDRRPAWLKQVLVASLAFLGARAAELVGVPVTDVGAFAAAALAFVFKLGDQARARKQPGYVGPR